MASLDNRAAPNDSCWAGLSLRAAERAVWPLLAALAACSGREPSNIDTNHQSTQKSLKGSSTQIVSDFKKHSSVSNAVSTASNSIVTGGNADGMSFGPIFTSQGFVNFSVSDRALYKIRTGSSKEGEMAHFLLGPTLKTAPGESAFVVFSQDQLHEYRVLVDLTLHSTLLSAYKAVVSNAPGDTSNLARGTGTAFSFSRDDLVQYQNFLLFQRERVLRGCLELEISCAGMLTSEKNGSRLPNYYKITQNQWTAYTDSVAKVMGIKRDKIDFSLGSVLNQYPNGQTFVTVATYGDGKTLSQTIFSSDQFGLVQASSKIDPIAISTCSKASNFSSMRHAP